MLCHNDSEALKWLAAGEAFALNPPGRLHATMMHSGVICDSENLKVVQSVVVPDAVSVVDVFVSIECAAKVRRHDDTMLKLVSAATAYCNVSI